MQAQISPGSAADGADDRRRLEAEVEPSRNGASTQLVVAARGEPIVESTHRIEDLSPNEEVGRRRELLVVHQLPLI